MTDTNWSGLNRLIRLNIDGETVDVQTGIPDVLKWERKYGGQFLQQRDSVSAFLQLAYFAMGRQDMEPRPGKTFEVFSEHILDFDLPDEEDDEEGADPTPEDH